MFTIKCLLLMILSTRKTGVDMSVKAIAIELYKAQQKVSRLESELENPAQKNKAKIEDELRLVRAELKMLRSMLDGEKAASPFKSNPSTFGTRR